MPKSTMTYVTIILPVALFLVLLLHYFAETNVEEALNGFVTSVSRNYACPGGNSSAIKISKTDGIDGSPQNSTKNVAGKIQSMPLETLNAPELNLRRFVYVYDLGPMYTTDILAMKLPWYHIQYDGDKYLTEALMDPDNATLFYVPFYSARYTLFHFKSEDLNMAYAVNKTSEVSCAC